MAGRGPPPPPPPPPPASPVALPRTANRPEHVASHHVRAARPQQQVACTGVGLVERLAEGPVMHLDTAAAERVLEALIRSCDKAVERHGHMTRGFAHAASTAPVRRSHRCARGILSEPQTPMPADPRPEMMLRQ